MSRSPWLAAILSMALPGLGHLYNGRLTEGLSYFLLFAFTIPISAFIALNGPSQILWLIVLLGVFVALGLYIWIIFDSFRISKTLGKNYKHVPYNHPSTYLAALFFGYFFVLNSLNDFTKLRYLEAFRVPSASMMPSFLPGDHFFVDKRVNYPGAKNLLHRGQAAIFVFPNDRTKVYIKRIIGLPGDQIELKENELRINGVSNRGKQISQFDNPEINALLSDSIAFEERGEFNTYPVLWKKDQKEENKHFVVPAGYAFVLGDHRGSSTDSRAFGFVPLTDILGVAKQVWLSIDPQGGIRWSRFGQQLTVN